MRWKGSLRDLLLRGLCLGAVAAQAQRFVVVSKGAHQLTLVDGRDLHMVAAMPVGEDPHEVVVAEDGSRAYVSNYGEGTLHTLAVLDLRRMVALPSIDLTPLRGAHGLALQKGKLWFTAEGSKAIGTFDLESQKVVSVLGTGQDKTHLVWISQDEGTIVASNAGSGTLSIFHRVLLRPTVVPGAPPSPASYTRPEWEQTLVRTGKAAEGFAVAPDERSIWIGNDDGSLQVIDLARGETIGTMDTGAPGVNRLRFLPDGKRLLLTTHTGKNLLVIDVGVRKVVKAIPIEERGASAILVQDDGKRALVACPRDHFVAVVDLVTMSRVATVDVGREPDGMAWVPAP